ncbi:hypothetical protein ACFW1A_34655 [Kitasatospora sp. NPDC058965]|uniref:hypothetical protein n=1 Tax=Kitasatospora sp. NPDC058965 TaxID=3346682 RepID=UPI0036C0DBA9
MEGTRDIDDLQELVARLIGSTVERVHVPADGEGEFGLQLRLTRPRADGTTQTRFRWLAIYSVAWRLDRPAAAADAVVAASGDPERRLAEDLAVLAGREITELGVRLPGWDTRIRFGDLELTIFPVYFHDPSAVPDWSFRMPSGRKLVVGPGPRWAMTA